MNLRRARAAAARTAGGGRGLAFLAQLAALGAAFVQVKLGAVWLPADEFGRFGLAIAVGASIHVLAIGPLVAWANRFYREAAEADTLGRYYGTLGLVAAVVLTVFIAAALALALGGAGLLDRLSISARLLLIAVALGLGLSLSELAIAAASAALWRGWAAAALLTVGAARIAGMVAARLAGGADAEGYLVAVAACVALVAAGLVGALLGRERRRGRLQRPRPQRSDLRAFAAYAAPFLAWGVPGYLLTFGDRLLLAYFLGPQETGAYVAMAAATVNATSVFGAAVNRVLEPAVYARAGAGRDAARLGAAARLINRSTVGLAVLALPAVALYAWLPGVWLSLFASGGFDAPEGALWLLLVAAILFLVSQQLILHGLVEKRPQVYLPAKFLHAALAMSLLAWWIPDHGITGAIWALLVAHGAQVVMIVVTTLATLGPSRLTLGAPPRMSAP